MFEPAESASNQRFYKEQIKKLNEQCSNTEKCRTSDESNIKALERKFQMKVLERPVGAVEQNTTEDLHEDVIVKAGIGNDRNGDDNNIREERFDEDRILGFLQSSMIDQEYKPIPPELVDVITHLLDKISDECVVIDQDQENWREILVYGVGVDSIKQEVNAQLQDFPEFKVKFREEEVRPQHRHMSRDKVSVTEKRARIDPPYWEDCKTVTCEFLVTAKATNKDEDQDPVHFAVVPAHMMLTDSEEGNAAEVEIQTTSVTENNDASRNSQLMVDNELTIRDQTRVIVEKNSTKRRYIAEWKDEEQDKLKHLNHPALFAYRQWFYIPPHFNAVENGANALSPRSNTSQTNRTARQLLCPNTANQCVSENGSELCLHRFVNDIALLHLSLTDARELKRQLPRQHISYGEELVLINTQERLDVLLRNKYPVVVGEFEGITWRPPIIIRYRENEYGKCLFFTLKSSATEGTPLLLSDGDCGMIVYIKGRDGQCQPVGLFIGEWNFRSRQRMTPSNGAGGERPVYQAIILNQALRNIEFDYPHHLERLCLFQLPSD